MQFIKPGINIDFVGKRKVAIVFSLALILISIVSLVIHNGPRYGVDFAGGTQVRVKFSGPAQIEQVKEGLKAVGLENSAVQQSVEHGEKEFQIRTPQPITDAKAISTDLKNALSTAAGSEAEIRSVDMVGPQVSHSLRTQALLAMFYALIFITIYISGRFELKWMLSGFVAIVLIGSVYFLSLFDVGMPLIITAAMGVSLVIFWKLKLKYAMGAIVALIHDVMITVGVFSLLDVEFNLPIIAALLTIIGYSLNDTIIVFDRVRETLSEHRDDMTMPEIINRSINDTLSRTTLTSLTTLAVVVALFALGGDVIHGFALAMMIGIVIGTYSSIFVASPLLLAWGDDT